MATFEEHDLREILKCATDIEYFAEKYVKIVQIRYERAIPFVSNEFQKDFFERYKRGDKDIWEMVARQKGKSTLASIVLLHQSLFHENNTAIITAPRMNMCDDILRNVFDFYNRLPEFLRRISRITVHDRAKIQFENRSQIRKVTIHDVDCVRGATVNTIYMDEYTFIEEKAVDKFFRWAFPAICNRGNPQIIAFSS